MTDDVPVFVVASNDMQGAFDDDLMDLMLKYKPHFPLPELMLAVLARRAGMIAVFCKIGPQNAMSTIEANYAHGVLLGCQMVQTDTHPFGNLEG